MATRKASSTAGQKSTARKRTVGDLSVSGKRAKDVVGGAGAAASSPEMMETLARRRTPGRR